MCFTKLVLPALSLALLPAATATAGLFGNGLLTGAAVPGCGNGCGEATCGVPAEVCGVTMQCAPDACGTQFCGEPPCVQEFLSDSCGGGCGEGCGEYFAGNDERFAGLFRRSDHCFDKFISPISNPIFFEDPRTLTEARMVVLNQRFPSALGGGDTQLLALQLRGALTEDVSVIVNKMGYFVSDGWADLSAGLKVNLYRDVASQTIVSAGTTLDMPSGSSGAAQGNGDGEFNLFLTGGSQLGTDWHYLMAGGWRLPVDQSAESTSIYWSNHIDRRLGNSGLYLLGECNWFHWSDDGNAFPLPIEGVDLMNFGAQGIDGNDIVTGALGVKYKPSAHLEFGFAWETPLTDRRDILEERYIVDMILRY